jgi:hypothetical protein
MATLIEGVAEALELGSQLGIDAARLADAIEGGPLDAPIADAKRQCQPLQERDPPPPRRESPRCSPLARARCELACPRNWLSRIRCNEPAGARRLAGVGRNSGGRKRLTACGGERPLFASQRSVWPFS